MSDAPAIRGIYNYYIENTPATFEETPLSLADMEARIEGISARYPYLVWEEAGEVIGYAYVNKWKERAAYLYSVEDSIYFKKGCEGRGMGKTLLSCLLDEVKKTQVHAIVAGITIPNERSIGLHEGFGFMKIAYFREIGFKMGEWLDVGYWELVL